MSSFLVRNLVARGKRRRWGRETERKETESELKDGKTAHKQKESEQSAGKRTQELRTRTQGNRN